MKVKNRTARSAVTKKRKTPVKTSRGALNKFHRSQVRQRGKALNNILEKAPSKKMSLHVAPMLATLVDKAFDEPGWIYEVKWDGYRALAFCQGQKVELRSRNDKSFNDKFYPVMQALKEWNVNAILDGEIIVTGESGASNFGDLQGWRSEADGELQYYVFDVLWYEGKDLTGLPLKERKAVLEKIIPKKGIIRLSNYFEESGEKFFAAASEMGLEGMIAKRADSVYKPGLRTRDWLKIKVNKRQEMVIGGYTVNEGSNKLFSSLLVGAYEGDELVYAGKVGTGFDRKLQQEMLRQFKPLIAKKAPFSFVPDVNKPSRFRPDPPNATVTWLKPQLVCEVSYIEMTGDGIMRHPSFEGMRDDKKAKDVVLEKAVRAKNGVRERKISGKGLLTPSGKKERRTFLNPTDETQVRSINGHELKFTNLSKLYWPKEKISKRDLLNYYYQVAPYILPYLKDRPQSMLRHPEGITGFSFYYKNVKGKAPDWVETYSYYSEADQDEKLYLVAKDEASLLYMVSLGCIEMNPWSSRVQSEDNPDWCIIDLDPGKNTTFDQVIEAALVTHDVLEDMGVKSYPKTSGSTGMHIYLPLGAKYSYDQSKEFARVVARRVQQELPAFTSIERAVKDRKGKMYVDFLQNRPQATVSAPYSVRPKPGATVSMPLHWEEVKKGLKMTDFTIHNAIERVRGEGDLFKPVLGKGIDLERIVEKIASEES